MTHSIYLYIAIMAGVSFLIRTLPLTLIRRPITNRFLRSFLFYVPYVTLAVMTFPAIVQATQSPLAGALALVLGIALAFTLYSPNASGAGSSLRFWGSADLTAEKQAAFGLNPLFRRGSYYVREGSPLPQ